MNTDTSTIFTTSIESATSRTRCLVETHCFFDTSSNVARHGTLAAELPNNTWLAEKTWAILHYNPKVYKENSTLVEIKKQIASEVKKRRDGLANEKSSEASTNFHTEWTPLKVTDKEKAQRRQVIASLKSETARATTKLQQRLCDIPVVVYSLEEITVGAANKVVVGWQELKKVDTNLKDVADNFRLVVQDAKRKFLKLAEGNPVAEEEKLTDWLGEYVAAQNVVRHNRFIRLIGTYNPHSLVINMILESLEDKASKPAYEKSRDPMDFLKRRCLKFDALIGKKKSNCDVEVILRRLYVAIINNSDTVTFRNVFNADATFLMEALAGMEESERATDMEKLYFKMVFDME